MTEKKQSAKIIFIIVLVGLFALSSILLALLSINIYRTAGSGTDGQQLDAASLYFADQVRRCEDKSKVKISTIGVDSPALVMGSIENGKELETWYYVADGSLKEATVRKGREVDPESGEIVMDLGTADFKMLTKELLQINMTTKDGAASSINLHLEGGGAND